MQDQISGIEWLITGEGNPRRFSLCSWFDVSEIAQKRLGSFNIQLKGKHGRNFETLVPLNEKKWFPKLKRRCGNFGLGLMPIDDDAIVAELESLIYGSANLIDSSMFFLYILQSDSSGRYYVGQTQSVSERLAYHNAGYSKSLRNRGPWKLVYTEEFATRSEAVRREQQIKSWKDRKMIEQLVSASR